MNHRLAYRRVATQGGCSRAGIGVRVTLTPASSVPERRSGVATEREGLEGLVTGGAGFIGSHLAERLCRDGHRVRVLDNLATGRRENLPEEIEFVEGDVRSYEQVHRCVRGCELVFHQAAVPSVPRSVRDPLTSHEANVTGTLNVSLAARDEGVRRVVFASSSSTYGANRELPAREQAPARPISPYAVGKLAAEGYCRAFFEVFGQEHGLAALLQHLRAAPGPALRVCGRDPSALSPRCSRGARRRSTETASSRVTSPMSTMPSPRTCSPPSATAWRRPSTRPPAAQTITLNALLEELRGIIGVDAEANYGEPRPGDKCGTRSPTSPGRATPWATSPLSDCAKGWRGPWSR